MKAYQFWAFVAVLLLCAGPALCQGNEDDKFAQPQIDVISDVEPIEVPSPKTPPKEKGNKRHPEDREPVSDKAPTGKDAPNPVPQEVDKNDKTDNSDHVGGKRSRKRSDSGRNLEKPPVVEAPAPAPVEKAPQEEVKPQQEQPPQEVPAKPEPVVEPEPVVQPEVVAEPIVEPVIDPVDSILELIEEPVIEEPEPVIEKPVEEPPKTVEAPKETPKTVENPTVNVPKTEVPPVQAEQAKPPVQEKPVDVKPAQPAQQTQQAPVNPQVEVAQPQIVQEKVPEPVKEIPQPATQQAPKQEVPPVKTPEPVNVKPAAPVKEEKKAVHNDEYVDQDEYLGLEEERDNYLDQYTVYSDTFYTHAERFVKEAVVPIYHHVRATPELSLGFSTLIVIYLINKVFGFLGRLFRKKPKFVYNKEEALSHADINNNFKKFLTELDSLKKQMDVNAKKGGSAAAAQPSGEGASIPQNLQNEISYIAQNLSKNEELLGKITKDRKQLDSFLFEFQKEVVESHKAIWNELYQLRKVFSQTKAPTSHLKARSEAKDLDDTKSLSSNPETERTRREEHRESAKKSTEPRSRSAAAPETNALKSRQPVVQKEKKPIQASEPEKVAPSLNGNGTEAHTHKEEEAEIKPHATQTPFGKQEVVEETQPEVLINTNLADKAPSHNPFATATSTPTITPSVNTPAKGIPFGVKGRPPVVKQPVIQTTFPHGHEPPAVNSGAKVEPTGELNSGLKATTPLQNNLMPAQVEEKLEEKPTTLPEPEQAPEEAKATERLSGADEMLGGGDGEEGNDGNTGSRGMIPPMRGPGPMGMGGPPGQRKPIIPTNKALPVPGRKPGLPGANVFKGPPGNIPRAAVPTQIKQPQGQVQDSTAKTGTAV